MRANNILIIGNYGAGNLGDDGIFAGIVSELREVGYQGKISLFHYGFNSSKDIYEAFDKFPHVPSGIRSFFKRSPATTEAIKKANLVILGGGGLFVDTESIRAPFIWYIQAAVCVKFGIPYICYSQSIGPLNLFISRFFVKKVFKNAKAIHVRDNSSFNLLKTLKIDKNITVSTDSALIWAAKKKKNIEKDNTFLLCLRKWEEKTNESWQKIIDECKQYAEQNSLVLKLLPMDLRNQSELKALELTGLEVLKPTSATEVLEIIEKSKILCSMRLHASIFALAVGTPVLSISYSTKVKSLIDFLHVKQGSAVLNLNEINKIYESLVSISNKTPDFNLEEFTKRNRDFLALALQI